MITMTMKQTNFILKPFYSMTFMFFLVFLLFIPSTLLANELQWQDLSSREQKLLQKFETNWVDMSFEKRQR